MGEAIGEVLAFGVGVALSPLAIIAVVLMLASPHGRRNAAAFIGAWVLGLSAVATVVLLLADEADASDDGAPADWVSIAKILLAVLLLVVAARQWRGRPDADAEPDLPSWMTQLGGITAARAGALAVLLVAVKPKNLLLAIAAAVAIAQTGASSGSQAIAVGVFVLIGTIGPGLPLAIDVLMPRRGPGILAGLREWMVRETTMIIAVLCLVLAAKLIGDALISLAG